jgi:hypothetical protein
MLSLSNEIISEMTCECWVQVSHNFGRRFALMICSACQHGMWIDEGTWVARGLGKRTVKLL